VARKAEIKSLFYITRERAIDPKVLSAEYLLGKR
jgi:hypothetical protein